MTDEVQDARLEESFRRWTEVVKRLEYANEHARPFRPLPQLEPDSPSPCITMQRYAVERFRHQFQFLALVVGQLLGLNPEDEHAFTPGAVAEAMRRHAFRLRQEPAFLAEAREMLQEAARHGANEPLRLRMQLWLEREARL